MTLDYLIREYIQRKYKRINDLKSKDDMVKSIYKKFGEIFIALNVDVKIFKEGDNKESAWNLPESCKEDLLNLIELIDGDGNSIVNIKKNNVGYDDLDTLKFCMDTVIKCLKCLGYSEEKVNDVSKSMITFTSYQVVSLKKRAQELIDDIDCMYDSDEDCLSFVEHTLFEKYAELEIKKLQEKLRFVYYSMNSDKSMQGLLRSSKEIKEISKLDGLDKCKEYILNELELEHAISQNEEYQEILQKEEKIINSMNMHISTKIKKIANEEGKKERIKHDLLNNLSGEILSHNIKSHEEELDNSYELLKDGVYTAENVLEAKNRKNEDDWPMFIAQCERFFN